MASGAKVGEVPAGLHVTLSSSEHVNLPSVHGSQHVSKQGNQPGSQIKMSLEDNLM